MKVVVKNNSQTFIDGGGKIHGSIFTRNKLVRNLIVASKDFYIW